MQQNSNQSKREQGFAHIGLILAVAVLMAALAFGGVVGVAEEQRQQTSQQD